jgi:hypothetical protein
VLRVVVVGKIIFNVVEDRKMKKILTLMCVLAMASLSFGDVLIGNFEGDGLDYVSWTNTDPADVVTTIGTTGATLGSQALEIDMINGGWGSFVTGFAILGTDAQAALASSGTVRLDALPVAGWEPPENGGWPGGWGGIELVIQGGGMAWGTMPAVTGLNIWDPSAQTLEWQLTQAQMDLVAAATDWLNFELLISTGDNDGSHPQMGTAYIDNVRIVPEPATLVMLGLGALLSLKRRKA